MNNPWLELFYMATSLFEPLKFYCILIMLYYLQSSHRLEKYFDIQECLEKSLKIEFALKTTWKTLKGLEKFSNLPFARGFNTDFGGLNQYKIVMPLFGAAYAAPN